jgi:hypothetical protein
VPELCLRKIVKKKKKTGFHLCLLGPEHDPLSGCSTGLPIAKLNLLQILECI